MNRKVPLVIAAMICSAGLYAQSGKVAGKVMDMEKGEPVPFASIQLSRDGKSVLSTASDINGDFKLDKIHDGTYTLIANAVGYDPGTTPGVSIMGKANLTITVELKPKRARIQEVIPIPLYIPKPINSEPKQIIDLSSHWGKEENFPLSKIGKSITYVPLETNKDCFLPQAASCRLLLTPDYILVITEKRPILVFSRQGKYLWKIGEIGNGPHETPEISNVVANQKAGWVAVKSSSEDKVLVFSIKGQFLREFGLDPGMSRIYEGPGGEIVCFKIPVPGTQDARRSLVFYSDRGEIVKTVEVFENKCDPNETYSWRFHTRLFWKDGMPRIIESPFKEGYVLNGSGQWSAEWQIKETEDRNITILDVDDFGDYLMITAANPAIHTFISSLITGEVTGCSFSIDGTRPDIKGLYNDLDGGLPFGPQSRVRDKEVAAIYDAGHLMDYAKGAMPTYGGKAPEMGQSFKDMAVKLTNEDNPVVVLLNLK